MIDRARFWIADRLQRLRTSISLPAKRRAIARHRSGAKKLTLPDFICIGGQKCGTSWLMENLGRHPQIFIPRNLPYFDIHYFDLHFHRPLEYYATFFEPGADKVKGECTPAYGFLTESRIRWIRRIVPDVRILLILRNPIERAWSHARMNLASDRGKDPSKVSDAEFMAHFHSGRSTIRSDFLLMLQRWEDVFDRDQIQVLFFDDVHRDPQAMLTRALRHLGVDPHVDWSQWELDKVVNPGKQLSIPTHLRAELESIYRPAIEVMAKRWGPPVTDWLARPHANVDTR